MDQKKQFAERLKAAMAAAGVELRPSALEKLFNLHYWGASVTYQGVRRWMLGLSIPEQEKLNLLADLLGTDAHALRYGSRASNQFERPKLRLADIAIHDRVAIEEYLSLPLDSRWALRQIIYSLARSGQANNKIIKSQIPSGGGRQGQ